MRGQARQFDTAGANAARSISSKDMDQPLNVQAFGTVQVQAAPLNSRKANFDNPQMINDAKLKNAANYPSLASNPDADFSDFNFTSTQVSQPDGGRGSIPQP